MRHLLSISLCVLLACSGDDATNDDDGSGGSGASTGTGAGTGNSGACGHAGEDEPAAVAGITAAHNAARCAVATADPLPPLAWSSEVAATAQAYADALAAEGCPLQHSSSPYGENIFWGSATYDGQFVVDAWMTEESCYSGGSIGDCSCTCGHYTQIVWRDTTRVGCGVGACPGGGEIWVCNYDPPGNYVGQPPF